MTAATLFSSSKELPGTETLILNAAIECVKRWGIERVTLNDIAKEASVARSTLYNYYSTRDEVIRAALLQSAYAFGMKLFVHIQHLKQPEDKLIEAVMFSLQTLPDEPSLVLLSDSSLSKMVNEHSLTTPQGLDMGSALLKVILNEAKYAPDEFAEMSETCIRFVISLVTMSSPVERSEDQWRGYIARRILPALGLKTPEQYKLLG